MMTAPHLHHLPLHIEEEDGVFTIHQTVGATADDVITIKITQDQAQQVAKFLTKPKQSTAEDAALVDGFADFWSAYPRKEGKARALQLWKTHRLHSQQALVMRHLNSVKHEDQWTEHGGRFVPHAATYLSQRRYLDEVVQADNSQFL